MAKTFNDIFPNGKGWEPANRSWRHKGTGHVVKEMPNSEIDGHIVRGLYCTTCEYAQPYASKDLELIEEPTGREAIYVALDAYLDAKEKYDAANAELIDASGKRLEAWESFKKLLNL